jgi:cell division septal protein FtsQ
MKKFNQIFLLFLVFILLSTYSSYEKNFTESKKFYNIKNIVITNNILLKDNEIKKNLSSVYNKNIFLIKRKDIEKPLKNLNFLDKIEVKKKYPNTIILKIYETKPLALLYKDQKKYIIDSSSNLISFKENSIFTNLPLVFGKNVEENFIYFLNKLKSKNFPIEKIIKYSYYQIGRWDIELDSNKVIKLPYNKIEDAIVKSIKLLKHKNFKNYNILDLRMDGKIVVE